VTRRLLGVVVRVGERFTAKSDPGEDGGGGGDGGADVIGEGGVDLVEEVGGDWGEDAGEAAGALGDSASFALFMGGGMIGEQAEGWGAVEGGAGGDETESEREPDEPNQEVCGLVPGHGGLEDGEDGETDGEHDEADRDEAWFAEGFDEAADEAALECGGEDAAVSEQITDEEVGIFVAAVEESGEGAFERGEAVDGEEVDEDQDAYGGALEGFGQAGEWWAWGCGGAIGLTAFAEDSVSEDEIEEADSGGDETWTGVSEEADGDRAQGGAEDEAQAEGHSDEAHVFGAFGGWADVGDVGIGDGEVGAADAGEDTGAEEEPKGGGATEEAGDAEEGVGSDGAEVTDEEDGATTDAI